MYEIFSYDYLDRPSRTYNARRWHVIYCANPNVTVEMLLSSLRTDLDHIMLPDRILLLGTIANKAEFLKFVNHPELKDLISGSNREIVKILYAIMGPNAEFEISDSKLLNDQVISKCKHEGLTYIFRKREGILESTPLLHYIKPSGKHCNRFIRTGNILVSGAEVSFIGFWLAKYLKNPMKYLYTDTATINSVAHSAINTLREIGLIKDKYPLIVSFSSYDGLNEFQFSAMREAYVLISASTSGELEKTLHQRHHIPLERIITLYYLGSPAKNGAVLCDLSTGGDRAPNYIMSYAEGACPLCAAGSIALTIIGDQFIPGSPKISVVGIKRKNIPDWLSKFLRVFVGKNIIKCFYAPYPGIENSWEVYLDMENLFNTPIREANSVSDDVPLYYIDRMLMQSVSHSVSRIIYTDDKPSKALAFRITRHLRKRFAKGEDLQTLSVSTIARNPSHFRNRRGMTIVVSCVMISGRRLLNASQVLRECQENDCLSYLVAVCRPRDEDRLKEICMNLQFGRGGPNHYQFFPGFSIFIPDGQHSISTSWEIERQFLLRPDLMQTKGRVRQFFERRLEILNNANNDRVRGLRNEVFLPRPNGAPLVLRPRFALWNFEYNINLTTQAEVYFTVCSILHNMRDVSSRKGPLTQLENHQAIISAYDFDRYSDGVIQASILRAAHPIELNYTVSRERSQEIIAVLESIFLNWNKDRGEAVYEFLFALGMKKMRIDGRLLSLFLGRFLDRKGKGLPSVLRYLCELVLKECTT